MRFDFGFLASKVARRIFLLFVVCALVPITALAIVSFGRVSSQLYANGEDRLKAAARAFGQSVVERMQFIEAELRLGKRGEMQAPAALTASTADPPATERFIALAFVGESTTTSVYGDPPPVPELTEEERAHLAMGLTLLATEARPGAPPLILMMQAVDEDNPDAGLIVGSVNPRYLWGAGTDSLPRNNQLCVFDQSYEVLFCTRPADGSVPEVVRAEVSSNHMGALEWSIGGDEYLAGYWTAPLAAQFSVPQWKIMLSESKADVLAPMAWFRRTFPFVVLLSLWVVFVLSLGQIRRSLGPLESLREGTQKIGDRQFESRVDIDSGDEFEELADSFNEMAGRLGKQFTALATIAEIDRTILSSLDIEKIVETVLAHASELIPCHALSVTLVSPDQQKVPRTYALRTGHANRSWVETTFFSDEDFHRFELDPEFFELGPEDGMPSYLTLLARTGCKRYLVLPMFISGQPSGAIAFGFSGEISYDDEDREQVRQLTDQVAVALSNAHLVEDLDALNWGALTALARTVDAKSPWTAGHSERVTAMGLKIGNMMKLGSDEIDILHRGGLLHDIGKIGVPAAILDKPGKLTEEEFDLMKKHPEIGANILQPIAAYEDVIPIVRQHHEKWDGTGYPDGLAAHEIHFHARIFAVADVYDALVSDRPYRDGMPLDKVIRIIVEGDGNHFDPEVVAAFLDVMTDEGHGVLRTGERPAASA